MVVLLPRKHDWQLTANQTCFAMRYLSERRHYYFTLLYSLALRCFSF
jgi:hypothetical protein